MTIRCISSSLMWWIHFGRSKLVFRSFLLLTGGRALKAAFWRHSLGFFPYPAGTVGFLSCRLLGHLPAFFHVTVSTDCSLVHRPSLLLSSSELPLSCSSSCSSSGSSSSTSSSSSTFSSLFSSTRPKILLNDHSHGRVSLVDPHSRQRASKEPSRLKWSFNIPF